MATGEPGARLLDREILLRLAKVARPYAVPLGGALLLLPLTAAVELVQPWLFKAGIDGPIAERNPQGLLPLAGILCLAMGVEFSLRFVQTWWMQRAGQHMVHDLRVAVHRHLLTLSESFYQRHPAGRLLTRVTGDAEGIGEMFASGFLTLLGDAVYLTGIGVALLLLDRDLALLTFLVLPILAVISQWFRGLLRGAYRDIRAQIAEVNGFLQERVSGVRVVQLFAREKASYQEFVDRNKDYMDASLRSIRYDALLFAVVDMLNSVVVALLLAYGARSITGHQLSVGALVAFLQYIDKFFVPIRDLSIKFAVMQSGMASAERIFGLLDETDRLPDGGGTVPEAQGVVEFRDVRFGYSPGQDVIQGLDLRLQPGEKVALLGATGAGKSTVLSLLNRTHDVGSGSILVDGLDVREWPMQALRRRVGVVLQDVFLFAGTVRDNLQPADEPISDEVLWKALRLAGAEAVVTRLGGLEGRIREGGNNMSAGERQMLAFARVLVFDPQVLVLDEATSNVDSFAEAQVQEAIRTAMASRTALVVAHRLSTIAEVDRIVVLKEGRKVEEGTHEQLMARGGLYRSLYELYFATSTRGEEGVP